MELDQRKLHDSLTGMALEWNPQKVLSDKGTEWLSLKLENAKTTTTNCNLHID